MTPDHRFGRAFWTVILLLLVGSIGCFGYAGKQLADARASRQALDVAGPKLRSPVSFERTSGPAASKPQAAFAGM